MKNIFAKAALMLFVVLIPSLLAAAAEQGYDKQPKRPARRSYSRKADDVKLNCDKKTLGGVLGRLNPDKTNTILVSGACNENVDIIGFQHLILIAENGASITDASEGEFAVVNVGYTTRFEMIGFTINGGRPGSYAHPTATAISPITRSRIPLAPEHTLTRPLRNLWAT